MSKLTISSGFPQVGNAGQTFKPNNDYNTKFRTSLPLYNTEMTYNRRNRKEPIHFQQAEVDVYKRELVKETKVSRYACMQSQEAVAVLENSVVLAREILSFNRVLAN
ncbi:hypothetical protein [Dyadobacter sediminis]|uniref:Uncharacterized protein n=1 Tax=Dyadobacter sediminis TaxID=1493691 RepID=A0A5R9KJ15_9BACT|nr:hypothetical protein [Dyadobacter sediminis]TLU96208.1 hypothetical protein FEM55_03440 [Dyadobacter sediminis]GGB80206.1 hypothetical protein GCM10011325_04680 [Dyadobacter sediminis]